MNQGTLCGLLLALAIAALLALCSCNTETFDELYGYWQVDSIDNRSSTGDLSEPWIKLSEDEWTTFVWYESTQWRRCTIRSGEITQIGGDSITFTEEHSGDPMTVAYSFDGTTFSITWPDDGEVHHMTTADTLPFPEGDAVSSPCFN